MSVHDENGRAFRIFDAHQHIGTLDAGGAEKVTAAALSDDADFARRCAELDRFGFDCAIAMPSLQYPRPNGLADTRAVNDSIARYRDRHRHRFPVALGTVQPTDPSELAVAEIERCASELQLDGIVWHHRFQGAFLADRRMHPLLDACARRQLAVFIHVIADSNMEAPWLLEELVEAHPDVQFVALDPLSGLTQIRYILQMAKRCPTLFFDTAFTVPVGRAIEEFVAAHGSERLLFGTDLYLAPPPLYVYPHVLREILSAPGLTDDDRANIFWTNAQRLFPRRLAENGATTA